MQEFDEAELLVEDDSFDENINKDFLLNLIDNDLTDLDWEDKSSLLDLRDKIDNGSVTSYNGYSY